MGFSTRMVIFLVLVAGGMYFMFWYTLEPASLSANQFKKLGLSEGFSYLVSAIILVLGPIVPATTFALLTRWEE